MPVSILRNVRTKDFIILGDGKGEITLSAGSWEKVCSDDGVQSAFRVWVHKTGLLIRTLPQIHSFLGNMDMSR